MSKKFLIIYHFEDNDGVCSGAMFNWYLRNKLHVEMSEIDMLPSNYASLEKLANEHFETNMTFNGLFSGYDNIVMTDISFNNGKVMKAIYEDFGPNFIWCDHHKPIIELSYKEGFDDVRGLRDTGCSAIMCAWRFLFDPFDFEYQNGDAPLTLRFLSSWDSWSWTKEGVNELWIRSFNIGVTTRSKLCTDYYYQFFDTWMLKTDLDSRQQHELYIAEVTDVGYIIVDKEVNDNKKLIETCGDGEWTLDNGRKAMMLVMHGSSGSMTFESVKDEYDNGIVFKHLKDGKWTMSLYNMKSEDTFDCGAYLKEKYNGGGHKGAAGCTITQEKFFELLKLTKI